MDSFTKFGLSEAILQSVKKCGFTTPTPIQSLVIPHILEKKDVVAKAETGSGKTAAFGLPSLHLLETDPTVTGILVITPTRELALQVSKELALLGQGLNVETTAIYGKSSAAAQVAAVKSGVNVIAATPGRLLDLLESKKLKGFNPSIIVLDEADEMLNMGFLEDVQEIFSYLPEKRQTLLFSATMPKPIQDLAKKILNDPEFVSTKDTGAAHRDIQHIFYEISDRDREKALFKILVQATPSKAIIFCKTRKDVDDLTGLLNHQGYRAKSLHGDIEQNQRQKVTKEFQLGNIPFLVATDVAARGLNMVGVSHIINYHAPSEPEQYVHRAGRTGRAGEKGIAITLGSPRNLKNLQRMLGLQDHEVEVKALPTAKELHEIQESEFIQKILGETIQNKAFEMVQKLTQLMEPEKLNITLLSALLSKATFITFEDVSVEKDRGDFKQSKERRRGPFGARKEGGSYGGRREGGSYGERKERGSFGPRKEGGPFKARKEGGSFGPRKEGESFGPRKEGGPFKERREGGFSPRKEGGSFGPRKEGGSFGPRKEGGSFGPRKEGGSFGDRKKFDHKDKPKNFSGMKRGSGEKVRSTTKTK